MAGEIADYYAISNSMEQPVRDLKNRATLIGDMTGQRPVEMENYIEQKGGYSTGKHLAFAGITAAIAGAILAFPLAIAGATAALVGLAIGAVVGIFSFASEQTEYTKDYSQYLNDFSSKAHQQNLQVRAHNVAPSIPTPEQQQKVFVDTEMQRRQAAARNAQNPEIPPR